MPAQEASHRMSNDQHNRTVATEPARTLAGPAPRTLGALDQTALWANLGVSLLGPIGALFVLAPTGVAPLTLAAAFTATLVGTALGAALLGLTAVPGADTGAPAMVLLRGLFGTRLSYLPTALNLLQCLGWAVFVLVVIADAAAQLLPWHTHWPYVLLAGVLTTLMSLRPLGVVRVLRRYALVAVLLATAYLFVQFARHPLPRVDTGSWTGFSLAADVVIAVAVSWAPLAADYSRHSRTPKAAFLGSFLGYTVSQTAFYTLGLLAFSTVVSRAGDTHTDLFAAFIALPVGWLAFGVIVIRELDESFTNVYSTVASLQNLWPLADRRRLAVAVGALATVIALLLQVKDYESFLFLLGSVFVPMFAVFIIDYYLLGGRGNWDVSASAPARPLMLAPWLLGFIAYQLVNPGAISWWVAPWTAVQHALHFTPPPWMSASLVSFTTAAAVTLLLAPLIRRRRLTTPTSPGTTKATTNTI